MEKYNPNIIYEQAFNPPYKEPRFSGEENNVKILFFHKKIWFLYNSIIKFYIPLNDVI